MSSQAAPSGATCSGGLLAFVQSDSIQHSLSITLHGSGTYSGPTAYLALRDKREPADADGCIEEVGVVAGVMDPAGPGAEVGAEGVGGYEEEAGGDGAHFN